MRSTIIIFLLVLVGQNIYAQIDLNQDLPIDINVRKGQLENGLTYYIRGNNHPQGHADFQIFHKVGAIEEEDNQNGLAHFLEHQAFKGLVNFPENTLLDYMEKIGVKFGRNLNAATTTDYTSYMINQVPISRQGIIDTCLLVLHDWSGSIIASQEAIDSERGVIREEWRMRGGLRLRISDAMAPYYYKDSKYAKRNVIGDMNIINNFKRKELLDFYHKWYRPDLQGIAIVGDFDPDEMEKSVIRIFSTIPKPISPNPKTHYPLPDNKDLIYGVYSDNEAPSSKIDLLFKHTKSEWSDRQRGSVYTKGYIYSLITSMMNSRWNEISYKNDLVLKKIHFGYGSFAGEKDVFGISADIKSGKNNLIPGLDMMLQESERFRRYGFTKSELRIAKAKFKRSLEKTYLERDKKTNSSFIKDYQNNFLRNTPILSEETSYTLLNQVLDNITLHEVNEIARSLFTDENMIMTIVTSVNDSSAIPSKDIVIDKLTEIRNFDLEPYTNKIVSELSPKVPPTPGKVIKENKIDFNAVEWTLSNGVKVYILPTEHKKDEIIMTAYSPGGYSLLNDDEFFSARMLSTALSVSGVGSLNSTELSDALAGKTVYVTPILSELFESITGATTPVDYETMLKLMYMYFTEARFDEEAFRLQMKKTKQNLIERKLNPFSALQDSVAYIRANYHPRASTLILEPDEIDQVDFNKVKQIYHKVYGHPANFTFVFTGAIDPEVIKPVVETYIGGLQGKQLDRNWMDVGKRSPKGEVFIDFKRKMETPKAITFIEYTHEADYSQRRETAMQLLQGILDIRFNKLLREERSATYSTAIEGRIIEEPYSKLQLIVSFETEPSLMDELTQVVYDELKRLSSDGVSNDDLAKAREYLIKNRRQLVINNNYWQYIMTDYAKKGGRNHHNNIDQYLIEIDSNEVTSLLREILEPNNVVNVTMRPE